MQGQLTTSLVGETLAAIHGCDLFTARGDRRNHIGARTGDIDVVSTAKIEQSESAETKVSEGEGSFSKFENNSLYLTRLIEQADLGRFFGESAKIFCRADVSTQTSAVKISPQVVVNAVVTITDLVDRQVEFGGDAEPSFFAERAALEKPKLRLGHGCLEVDDREGEQFNGFGTFANDFRSVLGTGDKRRGLDRFGAMTPFVGAQGFGDVVDDRTKPAKQFLEIGVDRQTTRIDPDMNPRFLAQSSTVTPERTDRRANADMEIQFTVVDPREHVAAAIVLTHLYQTPSARSRRRTRPSGGKSRA